MIVLSGALVLVALVLLVFGAVDRNLPYVYASIGVSVLSLLLLVVGILQRRGELSAGDEDVATTPVTDTTAELPAGIGVEQEQSGSGHAVSDAPTAVLPAPVEEPARPASRRVVPDEVDDAPEGPAAEQWADEGEDVEGEDVEDEDVEDEDVEDEDVEGEDVEDEGAAEGSGVTVLVVSGRPRYHLEGCRVLRGKEPQPLDRDDARTHGFSPCGVCRPDADETAAQDRPDPAAPQTAEDGLSFTETLFGEPLFADGAADVDESGALPDRPVQPVLADVEPAAPAGSRRRDRPAAELVVSADDVTPPVELHGEDPADDPTLVADHDATAAPSPDVAADPDELVGPDRAGPDDQAGEVVVEEPAAGAPEPADEVLTEEPVVQEPVVEEPAVEAPVLEDPAVEAPAVEAPVVEAPAVEDPAVEAPVVEEPVVEEPVVEPVVAGDVPVVEAALDDVEVAEAAGPAPRGRRTSAKVPAKRAPKAAPAAPAASTPDEPAPGPRAAKKAPVKKAPAKKAPVKKAPAKKAPAPAKQAPAPAKQAPAPAKQAAAAPAPEPQVKRPLMRTVRADALRLGAPSTGGTTTRVSARGATPAAGASVVVVPERDRFHRPECRFVRGAAGATPLPKAAATRQGYVACGVCKP